MRLLALDISLYTGYAADIGGRISWGTRDFSGTKGDYAVIGKRFNLWLNDFIDQYIPDTIIIEQSFYRFAKVTYLLSGLSWEAHRVAEHRKIRRVEYSPVSIKKYITGNAKAKKPEVMQAVKALGHNIKTDHEADAIAMLYLHRSKQ